MGNYRWLTEYSQLFLERDYLTEGQSVDERVDVICDTAQRLLGKPGFAKAFKENFQKGWYSLSTPIWTNFGTNRGTGISCFGSCISDDMQSIVSTWAEVSMMTKYGGGTSAYFGNLRPRGSKINQNGTSSGSVHFMQAFDTLINVISQGRARRGNFAAYLPIDHGDINEFLMLRSEGNPIQDLSYGVCVPDQWMQDMIDGNQDKRKIWAKVLESRINTGYPYISFIDTVNKNTVDCYRDKGTRITHSNLCCVTGDQRVVSDRGLLTAKELYEQGGTLTLSDGENAVNASEMKLVSPKSEIYKITLKNGMTHSVTKCHKIQGEHEMIRADKLLIGDKVAIQTKKGVFGHRSMEDEAFLLGLYQADGAQHKDLIMLDIWENDFDLIEEIEEKFAKVFNQYGCGTYVLKNQCGECGVRIIQPPKFHNQTVAQSKVKKKRLVSNCLKKSLGFEKGYIPSWIWESDEKSQWQYIRGLFYTGGTVNVTNGKGNPLYLSLININKSFLQEVQILLANLGIRTSLSLMRTAGECLLPDGKGGHKMYKTKDAFRLVCGHKNTVLLFEEKTGFLSRKKIYLKDRDYRDNSKKFSRIIAIEKVADEPVFCCEVYTEDHKWVCNGIITHNSEICLPDSEDESFVCDLSSMNILYYDEWKNTNAVELLVYLLDAVMTEFIEKAKKIKFMERAVRFAERHRALGIGWLGWHSYLQSKMIAWESMDAKYQNIAIAKNIKEAAYAASVKLAAEYGEPEVLEGYGRRNTTLLAIAPTKSCTTPDTKFKDSDLNNIDYFEFTMRGGLDLNEIMSIKVVLEDGNMVKYYYNDEIVVKRDGKEITIMACDIAVNDEVVKT